MNGRRGVREQWGVPTTELWFVDGAKYIGTTVIRHRLTSELRESGGPIGFHVVPTQRRRGYATQMLRAAIRCCRDLGLAQVLITCDVANAASRRVIEANGGRLERIKDGTCSYRVVPKIAAPDEARNLAH